MLCFHAELDTGTPLESSLADPTLYDTFLASRPQQLEVDAIRLINTLHAKYPSLRLHIVHLSAASALPLVMPAKSTGLPLTVETYFHYLALTSEHIPNGHPEFKCCPPVREGDKREELWKALEEGTIDCVVSDHSPCVASLKNLDTGDIMGAWGGISTLGLGLSLLWTEGKKRGVSLAKIIQWTSCATAKHASLNDRKGAIQVGYDADLIVWDPETEVKVRKAYVLKSQHLSLINLIRLPRNPLTLRIRFHRMWVSRWWARLSKLTYGANLYMIIRRDFPKTPWDNCCRSGCTINSEKNVSKYMLVEIMDQLCLNDQWMLVVLATAA